MLVVVTALLVLHAISGNSQNRDRTSLIPEYGPRASFRDGVLELRNGGGWLRAPHPCLDFRLAFEFRTTTPELDAGVVIRTWTGHDGWPGTGYRVRLPTDSGTDASAVLVGYRKPVAVIQKGQIVLKSREEWQQVEIAGEGPRITIVVNGTLVGLFDIETYGGQILFDNKKGRVQLRNISVFNTERVADIPDDMLTEVQLNAAGGQTPKLIREARPSYTSDAMRRLVQGYVALEAVVLPDGSTGAVRVKRSLDPDLDTSAIAAVRAWRFKPAVLNGKPVPMLVEVEMTFTLK